MFLFSVKVPLKIASVLTLFGQLQPYYQNNVGEFVFNEVFEG
ncbi:hypothetical protein FM109_00360 [Vibrio casei]|nr:hypothetical protein FM109_00360 [Vibrio casei]